MALFESVVGAFAGSAASAAGGYFANALFGPDKEPASSSKADSPTISPDAKVRSALEDIEIDSYPKGDGFIGGIVSRPTRQRTFEESQLMFATLYRDVMDQPLASPKVPNEVARAISANSSISSTKSGRKQLRKMLT